MTEYIANRFLKVWDEERNNAEGDMWRTAKLEFKEEMFWSPNRCSLVQSRSG